MKTKTKSQSNAEKKSALIQRVIAAKSQLPDSGVTSLFVKTFPTYKPAAKRAKVTAVLQFRSTDEQIVVLLESLAAKFN